MSCRCTGRRKCSLFACDMWEVSARKKSFFLLHLLLLLNFIWMDGPQIPISISFSELSVQAVLSIAMKCTVWCPAGWGLLIFPACGQQLLRGDREKVAPVDISSHGDVMVSKWAPGVSCWAERYLFSGSGPMGILGVGLEGARCWPRGLSQATGWDLQKDPGVRQKGFTAGRGEEEKKRWVWKFILIE